MAELSGTAINDLPDSAFAYIEPGGTKDAEGKTVPRSLRHFPIHDEAHVRNALARLSQSPFGDKARAKVEAAAKRMGIGEAAKSLMPIRAKALGPDEESAWFAGKIPRRLLAIPFGGPIPSAKSPIGVDYDGEWFSERTDIFAGVRALKDTRERLVDFSHSFAPPDQRYGDPTGMMTGHILGKSILDPDPEEDGWWVDIWLKAGDKRVRMIQALAQRGAQLFGSSQTIPGKSVIDRESGEWRAWPFVFETLSPAPSNTYSVLRPAKAMLEEADLAGIAVPAAMRELLERLRDLDSNLRQTSLAGDDGAKSGRELSRINDQEIEQALADLDEGYSKASSRLKSLIERVRARYQQ